MVEYNLPRIEANMNCEVIWEKFNLKTGTVEMLKGKIRSCGKLPQCEQTEYVRIEDEFGDFHVTIPKQIKEIMR